MANKIFLIGRLTQAPELTRTKADKSVCNLSLAVPRDYKPTDGERKTDFFKIEVWGKLAENCAKYLIQGSQINVIGEMQQDVYEKDGTKRYDYKVRADSIEFLSKPKETTADNSSAEEDMPY